MKRLANVAKSVRAPPSDIDLDLGKAIINVQIYDDAWSAFK
jgi:hypothetical protein